MNKLETAKTWFDNGVHLLPIQPNSKAIIGGFGPYRKRVTASRDIDYWFSDQRPYNLAVCANKDNGLLVLDFDDPALYGLWVVDIDPFLASTRTEKTPRGGFHAFYWVASVGGEYPPHGLKLVRGVELKAFCVVFPSVVNGIQYQVNDSPTRVIQDWRAVIPSFLLSKRQENQTPPLPRRKTGFSSSMDLVTAIKQAVSIYDLASSLTELKPSSPHETRWFVGRCPFHEDHNPSFWVDVQRGMWGCHSCKIGGDVINLYQLAHRVTVQEAIKALAVEVRR